MMDSDSAGNHAAGRELLPALIQCFGIIFIGYIFGRLQILPDSGKKGLCIFVQYLSLPALIFTAVASISFDNVNWIFIASVFVAKTIVFFAVALISLVLIKPVHVGKAGLYAIAATQSNDFAMGYPLLLSLYQNTHSSYPSLLYLIAPIQLLVLNPIGFFMLEIYKHFQDDSNSHRSPFTSVIKGIFSNPIVAMTALGIIWNFAFHHTVPLPISHMLNALSSAFPATALFLLGHNMTGKISKFRGYFVLTPTLLILTKIFILPLILQKIVIMLTKGLNTDPAEDLSTLGFLYGTIPCAPSVFVFACQYNLGIDIITSTIIFSTLCSAPLMLVSATMASLSNHGFENITIYMENTIGYVSSINLVACLWLLTMFLIGKRWYNICYGATLYLIIAQLITSSGGILCFFRNSNIKGILEAEYLMTSAGIISSRMWTVYLAVLLFLLQWRSLCFILRARYMLNIAGFVISFGIAFLLTGSLLSYTVPLASANPIFPLGYSQVLLIAVITLLCLLMTTTALILQHRYRRINLSCHYSETVESNDETSPIIQHNTPINCITNLEPNSDGHIFDSKTDGQHGICDQNYSDQLCSKPFPVDIEDMGNSDCLIRTISSVNADAPIQQTFCDAHFSCNTEQRRLCEHSVDQYQNQDMNLEESKRVLRHIVLLIILSFSMFVTFAVCLWKLFLEAKSGIFVELEFLDIALSYGQGIIYFLIFGLDTTLIKPLIKIWQRIRCLNSTSSV